MEFTNFHNVYKISLCRTNWVKIYGEQYYPSSYIVCGQHSNDLPAFGKIIEILIIIGTPLFVIDVFDTVGINNHLSSFVVHKTLVKTIILASKLNYKKPLSAHFCVNDTNIYIALHSCIFNNLI